VSELLRERGDFRELLLAAAEAKGLPVGLIEKDYWLTQLLRRLARDHYGQFILKGGTSLSKGYDLIPRFSEDIDLLLTVGQSDRHDDAVAATMSAFRKTIDEVFDAAVRNDRAEDGVVAVLTVTYSMTQPAADGVDQFIRVDYGVGGGAQPQDEVTVSTLVGEALEEAGQGSSAYADLKPFRLTVLHPSRTLVEKLLLLHGLATRVLAGATTVRSRDVRHYFDVFHLLDDERSPAGDWIRQAGSVAPLVADVRRITESHFGPLGDVPADLSSSAAFHEPAVLDLVRDRYPRMVQALAFRGREHPTLDDVLARLAAVDFLGE